MNSENVREYLESLIEDIISENNYDISVAGGLGFYSHDWIKEKFDIKVTPYVLTTNMLKKETSDINSYRFRYTLVMLAFDKDRESIIGIYQKLGERLDRTTLGDFNYKFSAANVAFGADFSEGSGYGTRRFEALFEIEGRASNNYNLDNVTLSFDNNDIKVKSFKFEHSKGTLINQSDEYDNDINRAINKNLLVIETILSSSNTEVMNLIGSKQKVNMVGDLKLSIADTDVIDDSFELENFIVRSDSENDRIIVYLYFGLEERKMTIKINNELLPIATFNVTMAVEHEPHKTPLTNTIKNLYLGKARSYLFNVTEDTNFNVLDDLMEDLLGENENAPIYEVEITYGANVYNKTLLLTEATREMEGVITLKFIEGSVL